MLKKINAIVLAFMVSLSGGLIAAAQQAHGSAQLTGVVAPALRLSLGASAYAISGSLPTANAPQISGEASGPTSARVLISGGSLNGAVRMALPLEIRSNTAYQLKLSLLSSSGCVPEIVTTIGTLRPTGALVMNGAAENCRVVQDLSLSGIAGAAAVLYGPRVSARGLFTSASNALLVDLNLLLSEHHAQNCSWQAVLGVSLEPRV